MATVHIFGWMILTCAAIGLLLAGYVTICELEAQKMENSDAYLFMMMLYVLCIIACAIGLVAGISLVRA